MPSEHFKIAATLMLKYICEPTRSEKDIMHIKTSFRFKTLRYQYLEYSFVTCIHKICIIFDVGIVSCMVLTKYVEGWL